MTNPTQPTIGLALGSGGARGAAHVGVLEVLQEIGIECSVIAGSSIGALIGGAYAAGMTPTEIGTLVKKAGWQDLGKVTVGKRKGLLDTSPLEQAIERHLGPLQIEDLPRRFVAVAYGLRNRERVLITTGSLSAAIRASIAVPGVFPPVEIEGRLLVDGGLAESVPVAAAMGLGADRVIAVSLGGDDNTAGRLGHFLDIAASVVLRIEPTTTATNSDADLLLEPATDGLARWSPRDVAELVEAGRDAATASIESLRRVALPA
jgi:NTE family protein